MGRVSEAEAMFREALISHERVGNMSGIGWMLLELAATAVTAANPHGQYCSAVPRDHLRANRVEASRFTSSCTLPSA